MNADTEGPMQTTVQTTTDGRAAIKQSNGSVVLLSAEQILTVINELHACYDYCAAWKESTQESDRVVLCEIRS